MQSWKMPTPEQVDRAVALLAHVEQYRYFFDRLENPEWLEPLWQKGFFRHPPQPERNEEEGTIRFPPWSEARYLARMARHKPELVANIIQKMDDTDNAMVISNLMDVPKKLGQLISYLAKGGKTDEALRVARVLLDVLPDERRMESAQTASKLPRWVLRAYS